MTPQLNIFDEIGISASRLAVVEPFLSDNPGPATVHINSPGGIATEGAAIAAAIERHGNVTIRVSGIAASAASLVMVAGKRIILHRDALVMIHDPAALAYGTGPQLRKWADDLDKIGTVYAASYSHHTGNPVKTVAKWMADETWLTAEEAVALNFADEIEGEAAAEAATFDYTAFRNAPAQLVQLARKNGWAAARPNKTGKKETSNA